MRTITLRIGTMGLTASPHYVLPTLSALELALRDLGHKGEPAPASPRPRPPSPKRPEVCDGRSAHRRSRRLSLGLRGLGGPPARGQPSARLQVFSQRGADDEDELIRRLGRARIAINIRAHARFSDARPRRLPKALKMISIWGTGTDNVDLGRGRTARPHRVQHARGSTPSRWPSTPSRSCWPSARKIPRIDREMRGGAWPREMLTQCLGKTLGVFGTGTIGARVIALGRALGMDVLAWSARGDDERT